MPVIDDVIKTSFVSELSGVAISNEMTWRIVDLGVDPGNFLSLIAITDAYAIAWAPPLSDTISISCAVYENLTSTEAKEISFPVGKVGDLLTSDPHPTDQVIRFAEYTMQQPDGTLKRGAYNLSGTAESLSTNGLINDVVPFNPLSDFLQDQLLLGTGWTIKPVQRFESTRGTNTAPVPAAELTDSFRSFVVDGLIGRTVFNRTDKSEAVITSNTATVVFGVLAGGTNNTWNPGDKYDIIPADFDFDDIVEVLCSPVFRKLSSRKTSLCQVA